MQQLHQQRYNKTKRNDINDDNACTLLGKHIHKGLAKLTQSCPHFVTYRSHFVNK